MRCAILSDIHGNIWALEVVLADLQKRDVGQILNLGDTLFGPLEPGETAARLMNLPLISVRGNQDRALLEGSPDKLPPTGRYSLEQLSDAQLAWLGRTHPVTAVYGEIFLCHGKPGSDTVYLLEEPAEGGGRLRQAAAIEADLEGIPQAVVLCGHSHSPRVVRLPGGRMVLNPGSLGLPAFSDEKPVPHQMVTGCPHTRYMIIESSGGDIRVEQIVLPYAWEKAARQARQNGRPDWAAWLESGRA